MLDSQLYFGDTSTAITSASTYYSTNVVDTGVTSQWGKGQPLYLCIHVGTAFSGGTNVTFVLCSDGDATVTTSDSTHVRLLVVTASLTAGAKFVIPIGGLDLERYLIMACISTGTYSAGTLDMYLTLDPQTAYSI